MVLSAPKTYRLAPAPIPSFPLIGIRSVLYLAFECPGRIHLPSHATDESRHAVYFELNSDGNLKELCQDYLTGERGADMLLIPLGVGSLNLLPKVRVEASDELNCVVDWEHFFIHEGLDCSPK